MKLWEVRYHALVIAEDLYRLDPEQQRRVIRAIRKKLSVDPMGYGQPLGGPLTGYWRLRAEHHRIIYRLDREARQVLTVMVGPRRDDEVYDDFLKRLKRGRIAGRQP